MTSASVWNIGDFTYRGIRFAAAPQGAHLGLRPGILGDKLQVTMTYPNPGAVRNLVADLGFRGTGTGTVNATILSMNWVDAFGG